MSPMIAGARSSATVQQMQPLASSTIASSGQAASAQPLTRSPSTPTSPNSLMISASRRPPAFARRWRISVVLPAPRKPVTMVTGVLASIGEPIFSSQRSVGERERRNARHHAFAKGERALAPGNDALGRGSIAAGGHDDIVEMRFAPEVSDDIGPLASARERDRARALAHGQAFNGFEGDIGLGAETLAERLEQARTHRPLVRLAGDAHKQGRGRTAAGGVHRPRQSVPANKSLDVKSEVCWAIMRAPWPPLRRLYGIHRRTAGLLARGVSPAPPSRTFQSS